MSLPEKVGLACRVLGISQEQVMAYTVYGDRVVLIEGPVGFKRFVSFEEMAEFEAKEKAEAVTEKQARTKARRGKK